LASICVCGHCCVAASASHTRPADPADRPDRSLNHRLPFKTPSKATCERVKRGCCRNGRLLEFRLRGQFRCVPQTFLTAPDPAGRKEPARNGARAALLSGLSSGSSLRAVRRRCPSMRRIYDIGRMCLRKFTPERVEPMSGWAVRASWVEFNHLFRIRKRRAKWLM
jgi:hypothetical protein